MAKQFPLLKRTLDAMAQTSSNEERNLIYGYMSLAAKKAPEYNKEYSTQEEAMEQFYSNIPPYLQGGYETLGTPTAEDIEEGKDLENILENTLPPGPTKRREERRIRKKQMDKEFEQILEFYSP